MGQSSRKIEELVMRFLKTAGVVAAFLTVIGTVVAQEMSKLYYAIDTEALGPLRVPQTSVVQRMVDSLVCNLTGKTTVAEAWKTLVAPTDTVGIKVSASGRSVSGTHPAVVDAIVRGLHDAGVPAGKIIVWDRNLDDLLAAGFRSTGGGYRLVGVDPATGYDSKEPVSAPVLGKLIWGDRKFGDRSGLDFAERLETGEQLSSKSYFARVLSQEVTKVINVPSLTDSFLTGINGAMANMTVANLDNWRRFAKSAAAGDPYIAEIYADPRIHDKVVVTILDALVLQYAGGPFPNPNYLVDNLTLFASKDPVAIDATAVRLIDEMRKTGKLPSIRRMTSYVEAGSALGLGQYAEPRIETVRVGVEGLR